MYTHLTGVFATSIPSPPTQNVCRFTHFLHPLAWHVIKFSSPDSTIAIQIYIHIHIIIDIHYIDSLPASTEYVQFTSLCTSFQPRFNYHRTDLHTHLQYIVPIPSMTGVLPYIHYQPTSTEHMQVYMTLYIHISVLATKYLSPRLSGCVQNICNFTSMAHVSVLVAKYLSPSLNWCRRASPPPSGCQGYVLG